MKPHEIMAIAAMGLIGLPIRAKSWLAPKALTYTAADFARMNKAQAKRDKRAERNLRNKQ